MKRLRLVESSMRNIKRSAKHINNLHVSWSYYGDIMLHKIVTNPCSHLQYHNQIINNLLSIYISSNMQNQPTAHALIITICTIHLLTLILLVPNLSQNIHLNFFDILILNAVSTIPSSYGDVLFRPFVCCHMEDFFSVVRECGNGV